MKTILIIIFSLSTSNLIGQNNFDLNEINFENKIVFYVLASWCKENINDYNLVKDSLIKYRNKVNLVLIADTISSYNYTFLEIKNTLKPDYIFLLNKFFPKRLSTPKEMKDLTSKFSSKLKYKFGLIGPSSLFVIENNVTKRIFLEERLLLLSNALNN
jgi:hypothetical protein